MAAWQIILIIIAIVVGVMIGITLAVRQQRNQRTATQWQRQCNQYVVAAWASLQLPDVPTGQLVDRVWGRHVALFHYAWTGDQLERETLATALQQVSGGVAVLSDDYERDGQCHFDVALMVNDATRAYLSDLEKIRHHNG